MAVQVLKSSKKKYAIDAMTTVPVGEALKFVNISTSVTAQGTAYHSANGRTRSPFLKRWLTA